MSKAANVSEDNVIKITEADLKDDQRDEVAKAMEAYKKACLQSYSRTRSGETVKKATLPTRHITVAENSGKMSEMIQQSVYQAMIDQSKVMTNTVYNVVVSSMVNGVAQGYQGPVYAHPIIVPVRSFLTVPNMSQSLLSRYRSRVGDATLQYPSVIMVQRPIHHKRHFTLHQFAPHNRRMQPQCRGGWQDYPPTWIRPLVTENLRCRCHFLRPVDQYPPQYLQTTSEIGRGASVPDPLRTAASIALYDEAAEALRQVDPMW
uniref:Uncharacterized protein n=1 Tax=Setaria viridis TaxID=4556 RepID=A0A4U6VH59_SETVI|nr:hypothetical protein SEVIR_3G331706v2 [Setaria viridis]